jgi:Transposase
MEKGLPGDRLRFVTGELSQRRPVSMLYAGLDLSRKRLDFRLLDGEGATVDVGAAPPDADGLHGLTERLERHGAPICAAIESMNGARFVHDRLELHGWQVEIADAQKVKGLTPLACKTDRIDAWVLAELARRDLVPAIWLPDPRVRAERERARWRLHLVRHRSSLKQRVHAVLLTHGKPCPVSDLFGVRGRQLLQRLDLPEPWQSTIEASLRLIDELDRAISECERELRRLGALWDKETRFGAAGVLSGPSRACERSAGWRRKGDRVGGRMRGGAERLGIGSGCDGGRDLGASGRRALSSASTSGVGRSWAGRLGSAATPSRASASVKRRSPATRLCAWARRNSDQLGPIRRGAGPRPAVRNTVAIVVAETLTPSPFSSPWMRM